MIHADACEELVARLRRSRERAGLSLAALAARTPYSKSSWERYLNGKKPVPRKAVEAFCAVTGEPAGRLLALWELADAAWSGRARQDAPAGLPAAHGRKADAGSRRWALPAVGAGAALVLLGAVFATAPQEPPKAAVEPLVRNPGCTAAACEGRDPLVMGCGGAKMIDTLSTHTTSGGQRLELRHADVCRALWVRATGLRAGERLELLLPDGRAQRTSVGTGAEVGGYVSTPMVSDEGGTRARVCVRPAANGRPQCFTHTAEP
ncbi:helix-turn-helix domain-containing protein [Streptomyces sudanensis]|uniref:helix-turn-helix domain-containing protein n=1 Tax=Streptomyces sudanensis TaxID=436397 RepID=UPI0020CCF03A|nr:XRE family transcriptional regulator [Streptomyces sudanensis]MCP9958859.1 XRE family transcriptional regulator [Streptomyces sudanensis]MCQ0000664.1 XRE family transcriptional regulator [Streptomyces sudanensis]